MDMAQMGKLLVIAGVLLALVGLLIWGLGSKFAWFGNLPGDIRVERENFTFYFPIVSMLLLSVALSGVLWLIGKFFR